MLRFQTYFGVPIPPFKERKLGAGAASIRFIVTGKIPSKKNNQMAVSVRRDAKNFLFQKQRNGEAIGFSDAIAAVDMVYSKMRGNQEYEAFVKVQKPIIQAQMKNQAVSHLTVPAAALSNVKKSEEVNTLWE